MLIRTQQELPRLPTPCSNSAMAGPLPDLSPMEHVWDQLKCQMSLCHSARDLEVAVQDLWSHRPQDNIRRLINSMPHHVAACIAAGGGPTRYWFCTVFESMHTLYLFNCLDFEIEWISLFFINTCIKFHFNPDAFFLVHYFQCSWVYKYSGDKIWYDFFGHRTAKESMAQ